MEGIDYMAEIEHLKAQVSSLDELLSVYERSAIEQTEQLEATIQTLKQTQAKLIQTEKMSSLGLLVAGVAHEINSPISFVSGNIDYLEEYSCGLLELVRLYQKHLPEPPDDIAELLKDLDFEFVSKDLKEVLGSVHLGTDRVKQIVKSLRNFSRLDESQWQEASVHESIESTLIILGYRLKFSSKLANRPSINLIKNYGDLPLIRCYSGPLNQVFMNLIANAIDAIEERFQEDEENHIPWDSRMPLALEITTKKVDKNWVRIQVRDTGKGLPDAAIARLFEPLFTTKSVGKGTGLGLSICHQIVVERHGGRISAEPAKDRGAVFTVELPIQLVDDDSNKN
ncbi:MAG: HAMP domain-containing sensor histidine kinase [Cyanobacteria bacterium P01_F01_bin.153]